MAASRFLAEDDSVSATQRLVPSLENELSAAFYGYCALDELRFQRCGRCESWRHPPRPLCATCLSFEWTWQLASRKGRILSWTVVHQAFHPAFVSEVPYAILLGDMDVGVRLMARLRNADLGLVPLVLDLPIAVEFEPISCGVALPLFRIESLDALGTGGEP